jgi:hypothetical protein
LRVFTSYSQFQFDLVEVLDIRAQRPEDGTISAAVRVLLANPRALVLGARSRTVTSVRSRSAMSIPSHLRV